MPAWVALLRAVNLGGTSTLPMADLVAICEAAGFTQVRTYIASGNVVFEADGDEGAVKRALEAGLHANAGKFVGVVVRSSAEIASVLAANPFPDAAPSRNVAIFLNAAPAADALAATTGIRDEVMQIGVREIYVHYPSGIGVSRLHIPAAAIGTARNMNTVAKLAAMSALISNPGKTT